MRTTHTYAILSVVPSVYAEIRSKLEAAGYHHVFHEHDGGEVIDMSGIALQAEPSDDTAASDPGFIFIDIVLPYSHQVERHGFSDRITIGDAADDIAHSASVYHPMKSPTFQRGDFVLNREDLVMAVLVDGDTVELVSVGGDV